MRRALGGADGGLDLGLVGHVGRDEPGAELAGQRLASPR
jgi:hypothetical protein